MNLFIFTKNFFTFSIYLQKYYFCKSYDFLQEIQKKSQVREMKFLYHQKILITFIGM